MFEYLMRKFWKEKLHKIQLYVVSKLLEAGGWWGLHGSCWLSPSLSTLTSPPNGMFSWSGFLLISARAQF